MKKAATSSTARAHVSVGKRTSQGGRRPKTSAMNKSRRRNHKRYRGQGR